MGRVTVTWRACMARRCAVSRAGVVDAERTVGSEPATAARMGVLRFGDFEADEDAFELRRRGRVVRVQGRVLEAIFYFLRSGGRVVTRRDLIHGPWHGTRVSDAAVSRAIMLARRALDDPSGEMLT